MISYQLGRARLPLPLQVKLMDPGENHERDMESRWTNERKAKPSRVASGGYLGLVVVAMVFKAARRDVANHSFESTRRRLGDHKARQGDALPF
jgi:hypothetical protein